MNLILNSGDIMIASEHTIRDKTLFTNEVDGDLHVSWDIYNKAIEDLAIQSPRQTVMNLTKLYV